MGYSYSAPQWLLVFFLYCVLGWCFESTVVSVKQRHFVNRGFLRGPMLPIYGFGAVLLLHVSLPLYDRPAALFFASMAAATVFEYIVGVVMEKLFKVKYWDYSEHRFQFRGYICLQSSLCWGFLGLILARFIHRPVEWVIALLPPGTPPMSARIFRTVWTSFSAALTSALRVSAARAGACCAATRPPVRHSTTQFSRS